MRVLHVCLCSQFNEDLAYQENSLIKYHRLLGHEVSVITTVMALNDTGVEVELQPGKYISKFGYPIYRLKHKGIKKLRRYHDFENQLKLVDPEFVFVHGTQFVDVKKLVDFCKNSNIRMIADNHADYYNSGQSWFSLNILHKVLWKYTTKYLVNYSQLIFGVSPVRCEFLHKVYGIPLNRIQLLPLGADDFQIEDVKKKLNVQNVKEKYGINGEFVIVTGGKIDKNKNFIELLKAINLIENQERIKLLVFGTIYPDVLEEIENLKFSNKFVTIGWLEPEGIYELFLIADLNIFIGSHSVLWEQAVACGIPTIFKRINGMEHINVCENSILIDNPSEYKHVSEWINTLMDDKEFYKTLKKNSMEAAKYFSYSEISKKALLMK
ncbi:glycosyltransferase involved in cell wall biosynthesis [Elizabethkingia sp. YR214]|uniref:glycosyltransferase family 4 protein n=1 Tax=Elizabethkingia sp. YR214 TaxID=2135667 RepID=UPI000D323017|nr:glycosyltransferase family 4 protein [Elizabethkingia sp. YR214]PUB28530.1 glycosyltransferase involved in cell wall biosynthesis [Elizabethkingia sp. YR214]